jgi:hypothetical protein
MTACSPAECGCSLAPSLHVLRTITREDAVSNVQEVLHRQRLDAAHKWLYTRLSYGWQLQPFAMCAFQASEYRIRGNSCAICSAALTAALIAALQVPVFGRCASLKAYSEFQATAGQLQSSANAISSSSSSGGTYRAVASSSRVAGIAGARVPSAAAAARAAQQAGLQLMGSAASQAGRASTWATCETSLE